MRPLSVLLVCAMSANLFAQNQPDFDEAAAGRFARLALGCLHREYPNKIAHVLNSDTDVKPPRELTPAFYGCYDWHSCVHGHWLLARLARIFPGAGFRPAAVKELGISFTAGNMTQEVRYLEGEGRSSFERPYGLAWLLQLGAELREWDAPEAREWAAVLAPLERAAVKRVEAWLPKLSHPVRAGEHSQTAFALGLMFDWSAVAREPGFRHLLTERARAFYGSDRDCPLSYEPSGEDFLSPCLAEADLMRRILNPKEFARWLDGFLPRIPRDGSGSWLRPGLVADRSDAKLVHLDGLNLSRAWMLEGIAASLPNADPRIAVLRQAALVHRTAGLAAVTDEHYAGGHWLGSFAVYLVSGRGLNVAP